MIYKLMLKLCMHRLMACSRVSHHRALRMLVEINATALIGTCRQCALGLKLSSLKVPKLTLNATRTSNKN